MNARKKFTALFVLGAVMVLLMLAPSSAFVQSEPVADSHAKAPRMFDREADTHWRYEPRAYTKSNRAADDPQRVGRDTSAAGDGTSASRRGTGPGHLLWEDRLDVSEFDQAFSAATLKDRVFVGGWVSKPETFDRDFFLRAYDTRTGTPLWQDQVDYGTDDFASAVVTDDKMVFATGRGFVRGGDWVVRAYDAETGVLVWEDVFDLAGGDDRTQREGLLVEKGLLYVGGSAETPSMLRVDAPADFAGRRGPIVWQTWSRPRTPPASGKLVEAAKLAQPDGDTRGDLGCRLGGDAGPNPFPPGSLTGAVLVVDRGTCFVSQKAVNAEQAGAVGMILVMQPGQEPFQFSTLDGAVGIPVVSIAHNKMTDLRSAVAAGTAVVVTIGDADAGGIDGIVRVYDAASGSLVWQDRFDFGASQPGTGDQARSFAIEAGRLFVGAYGAAADADAIVVRAYEARTGLLLWQHTTPGAAGFGFTFPRRVVVQGDRVIVGSTVETAQGAECLVQAHDVETGALIWQDRVNKGSSGDFLQDIDAHGGRVFAFATGGAGCRPPPANCDTFIRSYEAATGTLLWEREFDLSGFNDSAVNVRVGQGSVFLSSVVQVSGMSSGWLIQALDSSTGETRWESAGGDFELPLDLILHRKLLFVPGRSVDPATNNWDFIVRAYDARGPNSHTNDEDKAN